MISDDVDCKIEIAQNEILTLFLKLWNYKYCICVFQRAGPKLTNPPPREDAKEDNLEVILEVNVSWDNVVDFIGMIGVNFAAARSSTFLAMAKVSTLQEKREHFAFSKNK